MEHSTLNRLSFVLKAMKEKVKYLEKYCIEEWSRRMELERKLFRLEKRSLSREERAYLRGLVQYDRVMNAHRHSSQGLYSEFNREWLEFTSRLLDKLSDEPNEI